MSKGAGVMSTESYKNSSSGERMKNLCELLEEHRPKNHKLTAFDVPLTQDPEELRQNVSRTKLGKLLLQEGESMSIENGGEYFPDLKLNIGKTAVKAAYLSVFKSTFPDFKETDSGEIVENGELTMHELGLRFVHSNGENRAIEEVALANKENSVDKNPSKPYVYRDIFAPAYAETGYEGHNQKTYNPSETEAHEAIEFFENVYKKEKETPQG
jgi:hypothetical protein